MKPDSYYESLDKRTREYKDWKKKNKKKSEGLGDTVEKVTKTTGIKKAVELFSKATGIDCGCDERKAKLNELFSYGKRPECMSEDQYRAWETFKKEKTNVLTLLERKTIASLHSELFKHPYQEPCTCSPKIWMQWINDIEKVYRTYGE